MESFTLWTALISLVTLLSVYYLFGRRKILPCAGGVVITGASSGIGESTAIYLDGIGYTVFAGVRKNDDYDRLTEVLSSHSRAIMLDVTSKESIMEAVATVSSHLKKNNIGLVGLVNNAGVSVIGPMECVPEDELRSNFEVNVFGLINTTNAFSPLLRTGQKLPAHPTCPQDIATIIHIGSTMGKVSFSMYGPYAMTKYALEAMTDAQRLELSESSSIRVTLMELGNIKTPMFAKNNVRLKNNLRSMMMPQYKEFLDNIPKVVDVVTASAIEPIRVAKAVEDALRSANPKTRYQVGWEPWILPIVFSLIPDRMKDFIILRLFRTIAKK